MNRQKNSGLKFLVLGIIGAMMVCFFNMYLHTNRLDLLTEVPGVDIYNGYRFICLLTIGIIICFSFAILCISIRFHQKLLISIFYIIFGFLAVGSMQLTFSNYYGTQDASIWTPAEYSFRIAIIFLLSIIIYLIFETPKWISIISYVVNSIFLLTALVFTAFSKFFGESVNTTWYITCEVYQIVCIIGLIVTAVLLVKKDLPYSQHILVALIVFACYLPTNLMAVIYQPCYLTYYEVSFILMYMIIGFIILNIIIAEYDAAQRLIALEQELDKNFSQRKEHYETFAEQLDGIKDVPEYTYSPILPIEAILLYYAKNAKLKKINFEANFDVPKDVKIDHGELCLVLANLLDNAIEACEKMVDGKKKYISVEANIVEHMMMLEIKNSYDGLPLVPCGDLFYTTKEFTLKGMGLTTAKDIATRYNGSLSIQAIADVPDPYFTTQLFFPRVTR